MTPTSNHVGFVCIIQETIYKEIASVGYQGVINYEESGTYKKYILADPTGVSDDVLWFRFQIMSPNMPRDFMVSHILHQSGFESHGASVQLDATQYAIECRPKRSTVVGFGNEEVPVRWPGPPVVLPARAQTSFAQPGDLKHGLEYATPLQYVRERR